ncbi:hypothetical protein ASD28_18515 [Massilia sp. Root133]|jgi:hypothetical protein|uniref:DUF3106 domain-containing protein n=1 Tax=unclassified Massilia TaxID=2609279 RepID=UPI0006FC004D|nr:MULTISPECIES: DUF3106 domain-containing protein [unclassified Massilia]KQX95452.1 hypothetical protein ASD28_18515 [Massilia sp. Root133]KQZ34713.1 hypothetical protein ASD92_06195 [Massilia sp. Root1485]
MTANKLKVAGAAAAVVLVGAAALTLHQQGGFLPASGPTARDAADATTASTQPAKPATGSHKGGDKSLWRSLTPAQQVALQPLQAEWDQMDGVRKQKWLQLANRFATLKPEEQQRVHERMRAWAKLTPEQRELARETYTRTRKIAPEQKNATWESYLQLPEDQKKKLAASATARKTPRVVPSQANGKVVAPLGQGATSCPAGMIKNTVSAAPPCVTPPPPPAPVQPAPAQPPANPQPAPEPEKQVPANWGITPNNA